MNHLTKDLTYNFITGTTPPTREERIGSCSAYCGTCKPLVDGIKSGCTYRNQRKFSQSGGCQLILAVGIVSSLTNIVMIIHSPLGCCSSFTATSGIRKTLRAAKSKPDEEFRWIHTNLSELDVVQGGLAKLKNAIVYAEERYKPEAIIIANSCVPGIIGDDIDSLVGELQDSIQAKIVPIHCEGFKSRFVASGYDSAYHGILKYIINTDNEVSTRKDCNEKLDNKIVNIFNVGSNSSGDEVELSRIVSRLGLTPRVVPLHSSITDITSIKEASLNVSICATHDDYLLGHLKERYGTDYIIDTLPIGIKNTNRWLRLIANHFHLNNEVEEIIQEENEVLEGALKSFKEQLAGKRMFVGGGETRVLTTAEFFSSLGVKVLGLKSHNVDRFATFLFDEVEDETVIVDVAAGQPAEELNILNKLKPDIYIGHTGANGWISKLGIPNFPLFGQSLNYMGYKGAYELAKKASKILKNTNFVRNISSNLELPLTKEWYESDNRLNIKES